MNNIRNRGALTNCQKQFYSRFVPLVNHFSETAKYSFKTIIYVVSLEIKKNKK